MFISGEQFGIPKFCIFEIFEISELCFLYRIFLQIKWKIKLAFNINVGV